MTTTKKITLSTVKSFVKKNAGILFIDVRSKFDGMTDGIERRNDGFNSANETNEYIDHTLGVKGAWFVGSSRDYFKPYNDTQFTGIEISNSCGSFILAIKP